MIPSALFTPAQQKLLGLLFVRVNEGFHLNEIMRQTGLGSASAQRELKRLHVELVKLQEWVKHAGLKICVAHGGGSRRLIATVFPTMQHPVVVLDSGANVDCSAHELVQFARLGGVYAEDMLGRPFSQLYPPQQPDAADGEAATPARGEPHAHGARFAAGTARSPTCSR